jgi:hypothetical protein
MRTAPTASCAYAPAISISTTCASSRRLYEVVENRQPGESGRPEIPLAIPFQCAHSGDDLGVVTGSDPRARVLDLVKTALAADTTSQYDAARDAFSELTEQTYQQVRQELEPGWLLGFLREPRAQYDAHAQVVFRFVDQNGDPVRHFDVFFNSGEVREGQKKRGKVKWEPIGSLFEDKHLNDVSPSNITFYLRVRAFEKDAGDWVDKVRGVGGLHLEVTATEPETGDIVYLPLRVRLTNDQLQQIIQPHRTTIIDVRMMRLPSPKVFIIKPA